MFSRPVFLSKKEKKLPVVCSVKNSNMVALSHQFNTIMFEALQKQFSLVLSISGQLESKNKSGLELMYKFHNDQSRSE